jgi:DNA adenine methylase
MARSPFPWFGGKATPRIKNFILSNLPPHDKYIEPFGGGASILLAKEPVGVEVYNDVNRGLVNLFRVLADVDYFGKFLARVTLLPFSRALFEEYARTWAGVHDPVEQAVRWYVVARQSFAGLFGNTWGTATNSTQRGMAQTTSAWKSALESLPEIHARLQRVQIECADWRDCLKRYSGPGWLAYCDPPYVAGCRKAGGYAHELQDSDHRALIDALLGYDGAVVLSGYDSQLYRPLADAGWRKLEIQVVCYAAGRTRASGLQGVGAVKARQSRTECLWLKP